MSTTVKYALKIPGLNEYLRDEETRERDDAYTDDLGYAQLFETVEEAKSERRARETIVTIEIDEEGSMMEVTP